MSAPVLASVGPGEDDECVSVAVVGTPTLVRADVWTDDEVTGGTVVVGVVTGVVAGGEVTGGLVSVAVVHGAFGE